MSWLYTGKYVGTGNDNEAITGIGFQPDAVLIFRNASVSKIFRTSDGFTGSQSTTFGTTTGTFTTGIKSLDADGFTVGTHSAVNTVSAEYHFIALKADGVNFEVGSYTGNGTTQSPSTSFDPLLVIVKETVGGAVAEIRIDSLLATNSWQVGQGTFNTTGITATGTNQFTIGAKANVNTSSDTYVWMAFGSGVASSYVGDASDDRDITGLGIDPDFLVIKSASTPTDRGKISSIDDEETLKFESAAHATTNEIQALIADGFTIGTDNDVNNNGFTFYYFAAEDIVATTGPPLGTLSLMGAGR